jgi:hypothetical protein
MIAHSRTMFSSFAVQFALAIGVFYELGFGLVNLSPMAAFGLAVLPFVAVVVAPAFLTGGGRRAHDGKYLLWRFIAVQLVAVGLAAVAFGNLAWLQVPACFLLLAGVACLKRADLLDKGSDAPAVRLAIAFPLCLVVIMVLCCLAALHHLDWGVAELGLLLAAVPILVSLLPSLLAAGDAGAAVSPRPRLDLCQHGVFYLRHFSGGGRLCADQRPDTFSAPNAAGGDSEPRNRLDRAATRDFPRLFRDFSCGHRDGRIRFYYSGAGGRRIGTATRSTAGRRASPSVRLKQGRGWPKSLMGVASAPPTCASKRATLRGAAGT